GSALATATNPGEVRLRDARTGEPLGPPLRHPTLINTAAFLPDDATLMIASGAVVRFWDPIRGVEVRPRLEHPCGRVQAASGPEGASVSPPAPGPCGRLIDQAAISPDGTMVSTGGQDKVVLWDAARGTVLGDPLLHPRCVLAVAFDRGGETLAVGCNDGTAHLWDLATRRRLAGPLGHLGFVRGVAFRPDGKALLTASFDGHARLWDLARLERPAAPLLTGVGRDLALISPDGRLLLVNDVQSREASLWEIDPGPGPARAITARRRLWLKPPEDEPKVGGGINYAAFHAAFRPDGRLAATAGTDPV